MVCAIGGYSAFASRTSRLLSTPLLLIRPQVVHSRSRKHTRDAAVRKGRHTGCVHALSTRGRIASSDRLTALTWTPFTSHPPCLCNSLPLLPPLAAPVSARVPPTPACP